MANALSNIQNIQEQIFTFRSVQVMIDRDLAEMYHVPTKRLNEQVKRNIERFPDTFRFQLIHAETSELVANCDRFEKLKHSSVNPYVFTEQGVAMLSSVLRSKMAIQVSIQIMQAFVEMRKFIANNAAIFQRLEKVERKQLEADLQFEQLFAALENKSLKPKQGIFFNGQIFDAYTFVIRLIRTANKSILLIDNYVDDTVLTILSKRKKNVLTNIYTNKISKQLVLDLQKHNAQYEPLAIREFKNAHDRFLIIDNEDVYHFGASLKDLGKKWFAFSKMNVQVFEILRRLQKNEP